jgi:hypothetical protein
MDINFYNYTDLELTVGSMVNLKPPYACFVIQFEKCFQDVKNITNYHSDKIYNTPVIKDVYNNLRYVLNASLSGKNVSIVYNGGSVDYYIFDLHETETVLEKMKQNDKIIYYIKLLKNCIIKDIDNKINFSEIIDINT